jgi:hypothetical protein
MVTRIFALFALFFHLAASAQTVGLHLVSAHQHGGLNGINPGIYARFDSGLTLGTYRNSYGRQSVYAAETFETDQVHGFSAALTVGAITGYGRVFGPQYCERAEASTNPNIICYRDGRALAFLIAPSIAIHAGEYAVRLGLIPRVGVKDAALHLMIEQHF